MKEQDRLLLQAAIDGEMDAPALAAFEQRLAREPDLATGYAELRALRGALRAMPAPRAPDALRDRIAAMAVPAAPVARPQPRAAPWRAIAASIAMLGAGLAIGWNAAPHGPNVDREILAGHLRGLISTRPVDVVSKDQHTVKPWFAGKLAVAPVTPDLSSQGFVLEGGRIDIVAGEPAPTLVYRAGKHLISVTRLPSDARNFGAPAQRDIDGYAIANWSEDGVAYVATSDASAPELGAFVVAFRKAAGAAL